MEIDLSEWKTDNGQTIPMFIAFHASNFFQKDPSGYLITASFRRVGKRGRYPKEAEMKEAVEQEFERQWPDGGAIINCSSRFEYEQRDSETEVLFYDDRTDASYRTRLCEVEYLHLLSNKTYLHISMSVNKI